MNRSAAFIRAERARLTRPVATRNQRTRIAALSKEIGMEVPQVHWARDASKVIDRLEGICRQPTLGPM